MLMHIVTLLLAPVLLVQAKHVRRTTPLLPEPTGQREGVSGSGPALKIMIIGDSAAAGVGVTTQGEALSGKLLEQLKAYYTIHWNLYAKTGATTSSTLKKLDKIERKQVDVVVLSLGVNDVTGMIGRQVWLEQQQTLVEKAQEYFSPSAIIVCGLPPMHRFPVLPQPLRWYLGKKASLMSSALRKQLDSKSNVIFVPLNFADDPSLMASDGFHPGPVAYQLWANQLAAEILKQTGFSDKIDNQDD